MKYLAIDFGTKNIGLAVSDESERIASPLKIIKRKSDAQVIEEIKILIKNEEISKLLIGIPISDKEELSDQEQKCINFYNKLRKSLTTEVITWDESFSTKNVINKKKNLDAKAAAIFLQEFLDSSKK